MIQAYAATLFISASDREVYEEVQPQTQEKNEKTPSAHCSGKVCVYRLALSFTLLEHSVCNASVCQLTLKEKYEIEIRLVQSCTTVQ